MSANVLLVEDDAVLRTEILEYLVRRGYRVAACNSIAAAREYLEPIREPAAGPDTVICDIRLPDGDGVALYLSFARRFTNTKWVLMSGAHDLVRLGQQLSEVADLRNCSVIDKPIPLRLLERALRKSDSSDDL